MVVLWETLLVLKSMYSIYNVQVYVDFYQSTKSSNNLWKVLTIYLKFYQFPIPSISVYLFPYIYRSYPLSNHRNPQPTSQPPISNFFPQDEKTHQRRISKIKEETPPTSAHRAEPKFDPHSESSPNPFDQMHNYNRSQSVNSPSGFVNNLQVPLIF